MHFLLSNVVISASSIILVVFQNRVYAEVCQPDKFSNLQFTTLCVDHFSLNVSSIDAIIGDEELSLHRICEGSMVMVFKQGENGLLHLFHAIYFSQLQ